MVIISNGQTTAVSKKKNLTSPDFAPTPNVKTRINPDGSKTLFGAGQNGEDITLTPQERKAQEQGVGFVNNPNVQQANATIDKTVQTQKTEQGLQSAAQTQQIQQEVLAKEAARQAAIGSSIPSAIDLQNQAQQPNDQQTNLQNLKLQAAAIQGKPTSLADVKQRAVLRSKIIGGDLKQIATNIPESTARAVDIIRSGLTGKKTLNVQKAEQSFTDASNLVNLDITAVKNGEKNVDEALINAIQAAGAINRLEAETRTEGKLNLRWWADHGAELQAQIALEKGTLESQITELRLLKARQQFGQ